jgi:GT2 family glycosyltransferase
MDMNDKRLSRADVSVIVVNYNTAHLLKDMMASLRKAQGAAKTEVIIVDNASRDDSVALMRRDADFADVTLIVNEANVGFGRANNQAVRHASGRFVLLLNTDAFIQPDTLRKTLEFMEKEPGCGILGVRLTGRNGELQPSCRYFPTPWNVFLKRSGLSRWTPKARLVDDLLWDHDSVRECDWVPGCYLLIRREVIDHVGLFDPRFFLYFEEVDFCRTAKEAGWKVVYYPDTSVVHLGGESAKSDGELTAAGHQISALQIESELLYFRKHYGWLGVMAFVALSSITDLFNAFKWVLKGRALRGLQPVFDHVWAVFGVFARTRMGKVPTR